MNRPTHAVVAGLSAVALAAPLTLVGTAAHAADLSTQTAKSLQYMVAEEKLARDVYTVLGAKYTVPTFSNIARAEARHQSRVRALLATYGITDPTVGDAVGEFDDPRLQSLYETLIAQGRASITGAAKAGITVEKTDIADLDEALAANPPADVTRVLNALRSGSERHLAAFTRLEADPTATALHDRTSTGNRSGRMPGGRNWVAGNRA